MPVARTVPASLAAVAGALSLATIAVLASRHGGAVMAALALVGGFAGFALGHAAFGFAASWRRLIAEGRSAGLRAQLVMLAAAMLVFFPALGAGEILGRPVSGFVFPVGPGVVVGAFAFGIGMQLGGGCGSGTLYTAGGGSVRMLVTLAAFVAGSLVGAAHLPWWEALPNLGAHSLVTTLGWLPALALALVLLGGIALWARRREIARHGAAAPIAGPGAPLVGPWPLVWGALALAAVNVATLALAGRPWGITSAFALWGGKIAAAIGIPVATWPYFQAEPALDAPILADVTSVMNLALMAGALAASGLGGRFAPTWRIPWRSLAAAILGGLLMGWGARLAYGCNIGAFFSGLASGSPHGLVWAAAALAGSALGARLRPRFGL